MLCEQVRDTRSGIQKLITERGSWMVMRDSLSRQIPELWQVIAANLG
jgi:hypothetical protein